MDSVYFAFGGIAIVLIVHWAMIADRAGGPYIGLLAMRRPRVDDAGSPKDAKFKRRRMGGARK